MKRLTRQSLAAAVSIAVAGTVMAAIFWVAATARGTRWLLTSVAPLSGIGFTAQKIEGRLVDHLLLKDVRLNLGQQKLEIAAIELRWKPILLLTGTVAVKELAIDGVKIQDDPAPDNKPPVLAWPKASGNAQLFDAAIGRLRVTDLVYRRLQEEPVRVVSITSSALWQDGTLSISEFKAVSTSGQIEGSISAGFNQPSLTADLAIALAQPIAEMDRFSLQARRSIGTVPEPFVGTVLIAGSAGTRKLLEIGGDIGMARNAINLRRIRLTRPGQKGMLTADGSLAFTTLEAVLELQIKVGGLDLGPELNVPTDLSGTLKFAGTLDNYRGGFTLVNQAKGWQSATVSASYHGTSEGIKLAPMNASVIDGSLTGNLDIDWRKGFSIRGALSGRNLNPARIAPDWIGVANFNASGSAVWSGETPVAGSVSGSLLESRLHGQALTGELQADFAGDNLSLARLALRGKGFNLNASGELNQRLLMTAKISDFSLLVPGAAGTLLTEGWLRRRDGHLSGAIAGTGSGLGYAGTRIAAVNLTARLGPGTGYPLHAAASLRDVVHDNYRLNTVTVAADGTLSRHTITATLRSTGAEARLGLSAGYNNGVWRGKIARLAGSDTNGPWRMAAPAEFAVRAGNLSLSTLTITAGAAEHLEFSAELAPDLMIGKVRAQWAGINLARANPYLQDMRITGKSDGKLRVDFLSGKRLVMSGSAAGSGTFTGQGGSITFQRSQVTVDGSEQGLQIGMQLAMAGGGRLEGTFSSPAPLRLAMPEEGELKAELTAIDVALLKQWIPPDTRLEGRLSGRAKGSMLPGKRFELDGNATLTGGVLHRQRPEGELKLAFSSANASWGWRGEALSGTLSLAMAEYGQARGSFQLPVPARFPVAVNPGGTLGASLAGKVRETGIITSLFPGMVQESTGELDADLEISGTWEMPQVRGTLRLAGAGAYLPTAGIRLKDVQVAARLEKNLIQIDSFKAVSGPGHIEGTALITLDGWQVASYRGTIRGEKFQTVFSPELRILSSPNLSFEGTPQKIKVRGELSMPDMHIIGHQGKQVVSPSSDVVREGTVVPTATTSPLVMDVQVRVILGEQVFVKVAGIDAQLGGSIDLSMSSLDRITSKGEIKVIKGRYRTYGVDLNIVRGRLFFTGGHISRPTLDFLALRTVGNVRAGVTVAGTLQRPVTKLYSEPPMPDVDVLAYIVLGHPLGSSGEQADLLTQAAGALLTSGQATVLQGQLKSRLGLSTLEIQGGVGGTPSYMGYKPIQVTPPGAIPAEQHAGITETVLTVGKFLTPKLYISYGRSLFTGTNTFLLRYDIFKQWQIETQTGSESGADIFYKLEFK